MWSDDACGVHVLYVSECVVVFVMLDAAPIFLPELYAARQNAVMLMPGVYVEMCECSECKDHQTHFTREIL